MLLSIYKFWLCINYMENVVELLAHARTVDTRYSSLILLSAWERGYNLVVTGPMSYCNYYNVSSIQFELSEVARLFLLWPGNEARSSLGSALETPWLVLGGPLLSSYAPTG